MIGLYLKNYDNENTGNVSGLLLYAKTDEELEPKDDYLMGKNHIGVDYLDLSVEFEDIRGKLDSIVERELAYVSRLNGVTKNKASGGERFFKGLSHYDSPFGLLFYLSGLIKG